MHDEVDHTVNLICRILLAATDSICSESLTTFCTSLKRKLTDHVGDHWYEENPEKGQAARCITCSLGSMDPVILAAAKETNFDLSDVDIPFDFTIWVDPKQVVGRIGNFGSSSELFTIYGVDERNGEIKSFSDVLDIERLMERNLSHRPFHSSRHNARNMQLESDLYDSSVDIFGSSPVLFNHGMSRMNGSSSCPGIPTSYFHNSEHSNGFHSPSGSPNSHLNPYMTPPHSYSSSNTKNSPFRNSGFNSVKSRTNQGSAFISLSHGKCKTYHNGFRHQSNMCNGFNSNQNYPSTSPPSGISKKTGAYSWGHYDGEGVKA